MTLPLWRVLAGYYFRSSRYLVTIVYYHVSRLVSSNGATPFPCLTTRKSILTYIDYLYTRCLWNWKKSLVSVGSVCPRGQTGVGGRCLRNSMRSTLFCGAALAGAVLWGLVPSLLGSGRLAAALNPELYPSGSGYLACNIRKVLDVPRWLGQGIWNTDIPTKPFEMAVPGCNSHTFLTAIIYKLGWGPFLAVVLALVALAVWLLRRCLRHKSQLGRAVALAVFRGERIARDDRRAEKPPLSRYHIKVLIQKYRCCLQEMEAQQGALLCSAPCFSPWDHRFYRRRPRRQNPAAAPSAPHGSSPTTGCVGGRRWYRRRTASRCAGRARPLQSHRGPRRG